jgi:phage/plasmid-like protein (TIGR03299 family)
MAHNIARINGTDQAWYQGKPAWHGLGVVTTDAKTARQVVKMVPVFRQRVELAPVFAKIGGRMVEVEDKRATHRHGSNSVLGIVSPGYGVIQDEDALLTLEAVVKAARKAGFVTAGLLGNGSRGFASIDLSRVVDLRIKRDPSRQETHLFGSWAHDGTAALNAGLWHRRVECDNMLRMATAAAERSGMLVSIRHAGDVADAIREAQRILGFAETVGKAHVAEMNALADIAIPKPAKWIESFGQILIPIPADAERPASREEAREIIRSLFTNSKTLVGVPTSPYRAYQAVVEYADHARPLRIGPDVDPAVAADKRFRSITEGPAQDLKERALDLLRQEFLAPASVDKAYADMVVPVLRKSAR